MPYWKQPASLASRTVPVPVPELAQSLAPNAVPDTLRRWAAHGETLDAYLLVTGAGYAAGIRYGNGEGDCLSLVADHDRLRHLGAKYISGVCIEVKDSHGNRRGMATSIGAPDGADPVVYNRLLAWKTAAGEAMRAGMAEDIAAVLTEDEIEDILQRLVLKHGWKICETYCSPSGGDPVIEQIVFILGRHFDIAAGRISGSTILIDDLGLDSLDTLELVMAMEEQFNIEIDDADAEQCITVQNCADLVARLMTQKG